jgi:Fe-S-cluster containining protein
VTADEVVHLAEYFQDLEFLARDKHGRPLFAEGTFSMDVIGRRCYASIGNKCSIYGRRPAACRAYQRGGRQCQEVLRRAAKAKEENGAK